MDSFQFLTMKLLDVSREGVGCFENIAAMGTNVSGALIRWLREGVQEVIEVLQVILQEEKRKAC